MIIITIFFSAKSQFYFLVSTAKLKTAMAGGVVFVISLFWKQTQTQTNKSFPTQHALPFPFHIHSQYLCDCDVIRIRIRYCIHSILRFRCFTKENQLNSLFVRFRCSYSYIHIFDLVDPFDFLERNDIGCVQTNNFCLPKFFLLEIRQKFFFC